MSKREPALVGDPHRDGVRRRGLVIEQRAVGDRDHAGRRVDGEAAAGVVGQRIAERRARHPDRCRPPCRPRCRWRHSPRPSCPISVALVGASLTLVTAMVKTLSKREPTLIGHAHRDGVRGRALVVEQRAIRDRDHAGRGVDGEPPAGIVDQRIGERIAAGVRIGAGHCPDHRAVRVFSATDPPGSVRLVGGLTSVTVMVNALSKVSPSLSVVRTVML